MATEEKRRRGWRWYHTIIAISVFLTLVVGAYMWHLWSLRAQVRAQLDAIRTAGYPVTPGELNAWLPEVPAAENAAPVYAEAFSHYVDYDSGKGDLLPVVGTAALPARPEPISPEMKKTIEEYLAKNKDALDLLHKAADFRRCRFPVDWSKLPLPALPHLGGLRDGARRLKLEALLHAENGRPDLAVRSVTSGIAVGRSLRDEPTIISALVCMACDAIAATGMERVLSRTRLTDEQLASLAVVLEEAEKSCDTTRAWVGDRCMGIHLFTMPFTTLVEQMTMGKIDNAGAWIGVRAYTILGWRERDELLYLDFMSRYVEVVSKPPRERWIAAVAGAPEARRTLEGSSFLGMQCLKYIVTSSMLPGLDRFVGEDVKRIALFRAARTALAVERFRLKTGTLPAALSDLVPAYISAVPEDPFDGKPLRYRKLARGYVVYSVGDNGVDDGGCVAPGDDPTKDMTFTVGDDGPAPALTPPPTPPTPPSAPATTAPARPRTRRSF